MQSGVSAQPCPGPLESGSLELSIFAGLEKSLGNWDCQLSIQGKSPRVLAVITTAMCCPWTAP